MLFTQSKPGSRSRRSTLAVGKSAGLGAAAGAAASAAALLGPKAVTRLWHSHHYEVKEAGGSRIADVGLANWPAADSAGMSLIFREA
jgi:hypothetical protein